MTKETTKQRREREQQEQEALEQKFQAEKPIRLLHAMARAESLGVKASVYYRYDNVLYYEFDFSQINLPNSLDIITDPYEELSSWTMDSIENQLYKVHEKKNRAERLKNLKMEVLARLTNEEREALGVQELNVKDYMIRDDKVLIGDFDVKEYQRPIRDEEKIEVMMQMIIDLHTKFNRLRDI